MVKDWKYNFWLLNVYIWRNNFMFFFHVMLLVSILIILLIPWAVRTSLWSSRTWLVAAIAKRTTVATPSGERKHVEFPPSVPPPLPPQLELSPRQWLWPRVWWLQWPGGGEPWPARPSGNLSVSLISHISSFVRAGSRGLWPGIWQGLWRWRGFAFWLLQHQRCGQRYLHARHQVIRWNVTLSLYL